MKLEKLELMFEITEYTQSLCEWPHLKSLEIDCVDCSLNLVLHTLSYHNIIEELTITEGTFDYEDENAPPLFFDKLQRLTCELTENLSRSKFMRTLNKSWMPVIHTLELKFIVNKYLKNMILFDILEFVYRRRDTLRTIDLDFSDDFILPFKYVTTLLQMLKVCRMTKGPFLTIYIYPLELNEQEVSKIA